MDFIGPMLPDGYPGACQKNKKWADGSKEYTD
jgi:hypothetical protein